METNNTEFNAWCNIHGNQKKLADFCGVSLQAVGQWRKKIPAERVIEIETASGGELKREALRPDLYPAEGIAAA